MDILARQTVTFESKGVFCMRDQLYLGGYVVEMLPYAQTADLSTMAIYESTHDVLASFDK